MRLQKYMAACGVCSRRKAEELISAGSVFVNGTKVTEMGFVIDSERDSVTVGGNHIQIENEKIYVLLNKPKGFITSAKDQFGRKTVLDLVGGDSRLFPVGRLDYDTEGLLLITNDGDFAYRLTHPKYKVKKTYLAETKGTCSPEGIKRLREGLYIDGHKTAEADVEVVESKNGLTTLSIAIMEGRNRQVRKMCEAVGLKVVRLQRLSFGNLTLDGVSPGHHRRLTGGEIKELLESD